LFKVTGISDRLISVKSYSVVATSSKIGNTDKLHDLTCSIE